LIFSHLGIRSRMSLNGLRNEVPLRADMITILPLDAAVSANSVIYR
jgi:hypothetical protein